MDNMAVCERFYSEIMNGGNVGLINELFAEEFVEHEEFPGLGNDRASVGQFVTMMRTAFPDLRFTPDFMIADGDKVAIYGTMSGTHKGEFMGEAPTGKKFETKVADFVQFANGKAVAHWGVTDGAAMMEQLGINPGN